MKPERRNVKRRRTTTGETEGIGLDGSDKPVTPTSDSSYQVQEILASRVVNGKEEFHVKWKGFGMADCTWEPEKNIHAPEILAKFKLQGEGLKRKRRNVMPSEPNTRVKRDLRPRKGQSPITVHETVAIEDSMSSASSPSPVETVIEDTSPAFPLGDESTSVPPSHELSVAVSADSTTGKGLTEEPTTCVTICSSEIVSSSWISPEETPAPSSGEMTNPRNSPTVNACTGPICAQSEEQIDETKWRVMHLGPPPKKGVAGHWGLVIRNDGVQEYLPIQAVRRYFPNELFDYLLARIHFRKED